jgi:hypothetical protein
MRMTAESTQSVPFCFPVATDGYMFDLPDGTTPGGHHVLIRMEVVSADGRSTGVFYQDSGYANRYLFQPHEFRLPRADAPPYLPDLRLAPIDLVTGDGSGSAAVQYNVRVTYRAMPYLYHGVLEAIRRRIGPTASLTALIPESSRLSLRLPTDETGGGLASVPRDDAEVLFDHGIVDQIEVSAAECKRMLAFFKATGLDGSVDATLLGATTAIVPVRLSLQEVVGTVFDTTHAGPDDRGRYHVRIRNRIESAVHVNKLHRVQPAPGLVAYPQSDPGDRIAPGDKVELLYEVRREDSPDPVKPSEVPEFEPAVEVSIEIDLEVLLPRLLVSDGYASLTFPVPVQVDPAYFTGAPPEGMKPLSGVRVEFNPRASVVLTAATPKATALLRMPLVAFLTNDPTAKRYTYVVTNLHGSGEQTTEGATSVVAAGEGEAELTITPARPAGA